jgi:Flp pilus assembly pilin Flp
VGQAFRGLAKSLGRGTINPVTKSHLFAWTWHETRGARRTDSIRSRLAGAEGQALVEYTLTVSLVAIVCILALTTTGNSLSGILKSFAGQV